MYCIYFIVCRVTCGLACATSAQLFIVAILLFFIIFHLCMIMESGENFYIPRIIILLSFVKHSVKVDLLHNNAKTVF